MFLCTHEDLTYVVFPTYFTERNNARDWFICPLIYLKWEIFFLGTRWFFGRCQILQKTRSSFEQITFYLVICQLSRLELPASQPECKMVERFFVSKLILIHLGFFPFKYNTNAKYFTVLISGTVVYPFRWQPWMEQR